MELNKEWFNNLTNEEVSDLESGASTAEENDAYWGFYYEKKGMMRSLRMSKSGRFIISIYMKTKDELPDYEEVILDDGEHVLLCPKSTAYFKDNKNKWDSRKELGGHINKGNRKNFIEQYPLTLEDVYLKKYE